MFLTPQLITLENYFKNTETINTNISNSSVGWHIDHSLKVLITVSKAVKISKPEEYQLKFNKTRLYIFAKGSIPRGIAKAPKLVLPPENITKEGLIFQLEEANKLLHILEELPEKSNFKHPYFGLLNLPMTKKFLKLHTDHHLKIITDILTK